MAFSDEKDLASLERLIRVLRKHGVTHYAHDGLELRLGRVAIAPPRDTEVPVTNANEKPAEPRSSNPYEHPSLWPNGKRPSFSDS